MGYCQSCKRELPAVQKGVCPYCGFQNGSRETEFVFARRYVIRETFNGDRYGISYRGFDAVMGRAIQVRRFLAADGTPTEGESAYQRYERREKFMDVYRKLAALEVSSLPMIYTFKAEGMGAYAVFAYEPGRNLAEMLAQTGVRSYAETKELMLPVIVALKVMHDKQVCHGNVSLESICQTGKTTMLYDAMGGTDAAADIRAFLMVFENMLTADKILDTLYHCGEVAVGKQPAEEPAPPAYLLKLAESCDVKVTTLKTSLT